MTRAAAATLGALLAVGSAAATGDAAPAGDGLLFGYSFEADEDLATGPDTFSVFELARGTVSLTDRFRTSGFYAVEIADIADDGDFPELEAYFPRREAGWVFLHLEILFTVPGAPFDVALAGPRRYALEPGGIAFWLHAGPDGQVMHVSDSFPRRLFAPRPFTWYEVDLAYDVEGGRYDLRVFEEGVELPIVDLRGRPNATASAGGAVERLSFTGDREDRADTVYYLDDVAVAVDEDLRLAPFVAPGRRRFFVDRLPALLAAAKSGKAADAAAAEREAAALDAEGGDLAAYVALTGAGRHREARELAYAAAARAEADGGDAAGWREQAADAAFRAGDAAEALAVYEELLERPAPPSRLFLKIADAHFVLGDVDAERRLREAIYGRLD